MIWEFDFSDGLLLFVVDFLSFTEEFIQGNGGDTVFERELFDVLGEILLLDLGHVFVIVNVSG